MGTVRLTQERSSLYQGRAMDLFDKANPVPDFTPEEKSDMAIAIQMHPIQTEMSAFEQRLRTEWDVPDDTKRLPFNLHFPKIEVNDFYARSTADDQLRVHCRFNQEFTVYAGTSGYYSTEHRMEFIPEQFFDEPVKTLRWQQAIRRVGNARTERESKRDAYYRSVRDALENCNTLGQLIKLWPQAKELASDEDLRKLHTKETRVQAAKRVREEIELDVDSLNQVVLTANLLGD